MKKYVKWRYDILGVKDFSKQKFWKRNNEDIDKIDNKCIDNDLKRNETKA